MKPNLDDLLKLAEDDARRVIFKQRVQVPPTWFLSDGKRTMSLATPWGNDVERELAKMFMRIQVKLYHTVAYSFIAEVWSATQDTANPSEVQPRNRPDRKEMVFALATDGKTIRIRSWDIVRDWNEQIVALEAKESPALGFGGWTCSLLGKPEGVDADDAKG